LRQPNAAPPSACVGQILPVPHRARNPATEPSCEAVEFATLEWVDWFNNRRLLEPIGNIPPAEAEERYYAMLNEPAMAA
jgi:transposase InsO family protein